MLNISLKTLAAVSLFASSAAIAAPIVGQIGMSGNVDTLVSSAGTTLQFYDVVVRADSKNKVVTGDFDGLETQTVTMNNLTYDPNFSVAGANLWEVGSFSFELIGLTVNNRTADSLFLRGTGIVRAAGFDDTEGSWSYTTQDGFTITMPEPASVALLGLGLVGFAAARRKKQA